MNCMIETVRSITAADRAANRNWFSQVTNGAGVVTHALVDMHKHLRQASVSPLGVGLPVPVGAQ